ncbi:hypothetical protein A2V68_00530 [candidate division Kazan bacterium RBG_13_50_9]|uniref:Uncharacterized protein n=1 Tax=candidate division Kazan bacterium RBG_13_50_9 TaxID=1798535 RepID=A0A1F4NS25_UNCK3|nr:MAG: hypothetical protein A2V68_00530 [candidate division Kazan bacterium RBG_13_50_9]
MADKTQKKKGVSRLRSLLPKKKDFIMQMPEDGDEDIHWLFWVLVVLAVLFLISLLFIGW